MSILVATVRISRKPAFSGVLKLRQSGRNFGVTLPKRSMEAFGFKDEEDIYIIAYKLESDEPRIPEQTQEVR